jgi:Ni/Co efflux regulator RcnB
MRKFLIVIAAPALLATALPAAAESSQQQPRARDNSAQQQHDRDSDASERRICVTERLSGSRMPRRVCRTPAEWQTLQDGSDDPRL